MPARRRSPWWVRELAWAKLHALGGKLLNTYRSDGLSPNQEWLWGAVISELEYRNRHRPPVDRCTCLLCTTSLPDADMSVSVVMGRADGL